MDGEHGRRPSIDSGKPELVLTEFVQSDFAAKRAIIVWWKEQRMGRLMACSNTFGYEAPGSMSKYEGPSSREEWFSLTGSQSISAQGFPTRSQR